MIHFIDKTSEYTVEDVAEFLAKTKQSVFGVDTETEGLDFTKDRLIMFQIGNEHAQFIIDARQVSLEPLRNILEDKKVIKIFHNAKFDYKFIKQNTNIVCENIYDTYLVELINNCGKGLKHNLHEVCKRHLNVELDKTNRLTFVDYGDKPFTQGQIIYGAEDIEYLCKIREKQLIHTKKNKLEAVVDLENEATLAFADIEYNGLNLNQDDWIELEGVNTLKAEALLINLDEEITEDSRLTKFISKYIQGDIFTPVEDLRKINVKWTSPKQVLNVFQTLIPKLQNVNSKDMYKYRNKFSIIDTYIQYKEAMKLCTSYGKSFFNNLSADNKIHTNFHQILDTGRVSSSKPNMQQIPADNKFRNCFTAPQGWSFVSADYSSQELNVIAFGSKDPVWIAALKNGEDLHSTCAELVYGEKWLTSAQDDCNYLKRKGKCNCPAHKKLRTNVKTINFGLAYGMGPNKLADTLSISLDEAKKLIKKYFTAFPAIHSFLEKLGNFGKKYGYIKTFPPYNRRRWFTTWYPKIWNNKSSMMELGSIERASKNTPIQGASADMTKLALVMMRELIKDLDLPVKLIMTVHDQIDTVCKNDFIEKWSELMKITMEHSAEVIVTNGLLKAEVTVSDCWEK
jgi:DNA polymerase I-like protein with 3'-5' exonuclease and polymerase domains